MFSYAKLVHLKQTIHFVVRVYHQTVMFNPLVQTATTHIISPKENQHILRSNFAYKWSWMKRPMGLTVKLNLKFIIHRCALHIHINAPAARKAKKISPPFIYVCYVFVSFCNSLRFDFSIICISIECFAYRVDFIVVDWK